MDEDDLAPTSGAEISPADLRTALDTVIRESLKPYAGGLGILYAVFAVSHMIVQPRAVAIPLTIVAAGTMVVLLALYGALNRWEIPTRWAHPIGVGMIGLVLLNSLLHIYLTSEPRQTTNVMLLAIGTGFFLLSTYWLTIVLIVTWVSWGVVVWLAPPSPDWVHFGFGLLSASVLSVLVFTVRVRTLRRLEGLRVQEGRQRRELEKAVHETQQSEQKYRNLVEAARDVIFTLSVDGTLTSLNPAFEEITGWSRAEWVGKSFMPLVHPDDVPLALQLFRRAIQGETLSLFELRVIPKLGDCLFGEFTAAPQVQNGSTVGVLCIARDISERRRAEEIRLRAEVAEAARQKLEREIAERKRAEEALRRSEEYFRLLIENQRDLILLLNRDGTVRYQSPSTERQLGHKPEEIIGKSRFDLIHPDDLPRVMGMFANIVGEPGLTPSIELRVRHKDGTWRILEALGNNLLDDPVVAGIIVNTRDITDRKQAEEALQTSERRYRELFENANDAIMITTLDGIITDVNRALETMLGWSRAELIGQDYQKFVPPTVAAEGEDRARYALASEVLPAVFESEFLRKDGSTVPVETRARFIRDQDGRSIGVQGISRDISARKALEQQRTDFLAMLTHDIRNPLGLILGYADLLLDELQGEKAAEQKELILRLRNNIFTVHSLLENYLDLSKIEAGQLALAKVPVSINDVLRQVGQQYETEAQHKSLTFTLDLQEDLPPFAGDQLALERIFANLLLNAFKFTPNGGWVMVHSVVRNGEIMVTVMDNGPGMAPEEIPLLFEKYRRSERTQFQAGTGLGLFIAKTLVEAQGGRIEATGVPDQGSCFFVFLPVTSLAPPPAL